MQIVDDRRALHQIPELDDQLPQTTAYLTRALNVLRCQVFSPIPGAVCAYFHRGRPTTIAFRSDADALPIEEKTGLPFASREAGRMHACGHDGHMAMLLELARRLDTMERLPHNVLLVFQPSEETTGGARRICQSGVLEQYHVTAIFGMHLWPQLPKGVIASRPMEMMSRSCEVTVKITGRAAHIASASNGLDATAAGVEFYRRAMEMERDLPKSWRRLLKFGKFRSGTVRNAISASACLEGSLRAFQDEQFEAMQQALRRIAGQVSAETGCRVEVEMNDGYPAVINPPELLARARRAVEFDLLEKPVMITEDFSWYQRSLPGLFFFLGTGDTPPLHAATFNFDENILRQGADFWQRLAEGYKEEPCSNI